MKIPILKKEIIKIFQKYGLSKDHASISANALINADLKKIINNPDLKGHYYFTESFINKYISENIMDINPDLK